MYKPFYTNSWAFIVGINHYQHASPLEYATNDANALADVLISQYSFPKKNVILLRDSEATKKRILDDFIDFSNRAVEPDDRILFFFAGHGITVAGHRGKIGYLVPVEGKMEKLSTLVRWDDLTRSADLIPAKHILFIMDACYSGLALTRGTPPGSQRFVGDMLQRMARQVITAGKADEVVADDGGPGGGNSIFTGLLVEGLKGEALDHNGVLTANGLMAYIYEKVGQDNRSAQTPHYGYLFGDGDFIFRTPENEHLLTVPKTDYLLEPVSSKLEIAETESIEISKPSYAIENGYRDPSHPSFGRNEWTPKLVESRSGRTNEGFFSDETKAFSWLSLIIEPSSSEGITMDIAQLARTLQDLKPGSERLFEQFRVPGNKKTTLHSAIFFDHLHNRPKEWTRYLRLNVSGAIEYVDSSSFLFVDRDGQRYFKYVQIIGITWQFMHFAKNVLTNAGYLLGIRFLFNLVGTKESTLTDFSKEEGNNKKHWVNPNEESMWGRYDGSAINCNEQNLQLEYSIALADLDEAKSKTVVDDIAGKLGLAYNHQSSPRCFNYDTDIFPWNQYRAYLRDLYYGYM